MRYSCFHSEGKSSAATQCRGLHLLDFGKALNGMNDRQGSDDGLGFCHSGCPAGSICLATFFI